MTSDLADFVEQLLDLLASSDCSLEKLRRLSEEFKSTRKMAFLAEADCEEY